MPQIEVFCTVSNCRHWGEGDRCVAEKILITSDEIGQLYPEALDAADTADVVRQHGHTEARTCMETCCKTFTARGGSQPAGPARRSTQELARQR